MDKIVTYIYLLVMHVTSHKLGSQAIMLLGNVCIL